MRKNLLLVLLYAFIVIFVLGIIPQFTILIENVYIALVINIVAIVLQVFFIILMIKCVKEIYVKSVDSNEKIISKKFKIIILLCIFLAILIDVILYIGFYIL